jgi:HD-GYP domain-containing protein (c-di-GMP phosphodiesterase class II)
VIGAKIIKPLSFLDEVAPIVLYHHERNDGSGYPEGLMEKAIPIGARIIAVCDSFDAMTSERPGTVARHPEAVTPYTLPKDYVSAAST